MKFSEAELIAIHPILSIAVFREDTCRSPAVNRSFPFTTRGINEETHASFYIPAPNMGEVNQVKFSEAELIAIHMNIVDRGVPRRHLEIAYSK